MNAPTPGRRLEMVAGEREVCAALDADDALVREGWQRRYMTSKSKGEEARAMYESLGYEVTTRAPKLEEFDDGCSGCGMQSCREDVVVYTRRLPEQKAPYSEETR